MGDFLMAREEQDHVSELVVEGFFRSELPREHRARLVRHLLTRCPDCQRTAASVARRHGFLMPPEESSRPTAPGGAELYAETFLRLLHEAQRHAVRIARDRQEGERRLAEIERIPPGERLDAIREQRRFHLWGLYDRLLSRSLAVSRSDPAAGVDLAHLALAALATLPAGTHPPALLADFRAAAMGALAGAQRLAGRFEEARAALWSAWEHLEDGSGDPLETANLLCLEAALHGDSGQFERAVAVLQEAAQIYREMGDESRCASLLVQQAAALAKARARRNLPARAKRRSGGGRSRRRA
jgi:hypothetical protein